jgi:methylmalonyl-CoA epimerase
VRALRIDHVAIAVEELGPVLDLLGLFGLGIESEEELPDQGVKSSMVGAGNTQIELIEATAPDAPLAKFLAERGPGLHHVCVEVDDLEDAIATLQAKGLRLVDPEPRSDMAGRRVFLHPASGRGVLIGIMERHKED